MPRWLILLLFWVVAVLFIVASIIVLLDPTVLGLFRPKQVPPELKSFVTRTTVYQRVLTPMAIVLGGLFAYYRLRRERTHVARLQSTLGCEPSLVDDRVFLAVDFSCTNVGNAEVKLEGRYGDITFYGWGPNAKAKWRLEEPSPILGHDPMLEPGETALGSAWFETSGTEWNAIEVEVRIARNLKSNRVYSKVVNLKGLASDEKRETSEEAALNRSLVEREGSVTRFARRWGI